MNVSQRLGGAVWLVATFAAILIAWTPMTQARVTRIVIDAKTSPAFPFKEGGGYQSFGAAGQYETISGRAFGELDPDDPRNAIIQDIALAPRNANGKVEYVASFYLVKPIDMSRASGLLWHDVPNRGRRITIPPAERNLGDVGLSSGWEGDNAGNTVPGANNDWVTVPVAKNPDGSPITGLVLGRIVNRSGPESQPLIVQTNPLADGGGIRWSISRGRSQSGNFLRGFLHLGFNQDEAGRQVHDGAWPIIAGRRIGMNFRWAQPDGVLELYQAGSEGPQWWGPWPDKIRGLPTRGILDRCTASKTCPKIIEHFGSAEVWGLKLTPEWVGTAADADIPLPSNVRRYYIPSSAHGGGPGGFNSSLADTLLPPSNCPGNNFGAALLNANPLPHTETYNAIRFHFRNWVMKGTPPPPNRYPTLAEKYLIDATKEAMGFPTLPGLPPTVPSNFIMPVLDYDFGPDFNYSDGSGIPTVMPPRIKRVIRMLVPKVDADGNELGGVPVVLRAAPLGTYLGWNITAGGARPFHQGQICNYMGGMIPFAKTRAERLANSDPRLSLEERYGNHQGYVDTVTAAAKYAVKQGFLLQPDADALIAQARASNVLK